MGFKASSRVRIRPCPPYKKPRFEAGFFFFGPMPSLDPGEWPHGRRAAYSATPRSAHDPADNAPMDALRRRPRRAVPPPRPDDYLRFEAGFSFSGPIP